MVHCPVHVFGLSLAFATDRDEDCGAFGIDLNGLRDPRLREDNEAAAE